MTNAAEFQQYGREMIDIVTGYLENIRERPIVPDIQPGFLPPQLPDHAPQEPEAWADVVKDVQNIILPGVTNWHHPNFHAFYPTANSYAAILGDMLSDAIGAVGFTWQASPVTTELEVVVMDWVAKALGLPEHFLHSHPGPGGGVIQGTASEATMVAFLAARGRAINKMRATEPDATPHQLLGRLVAFTSDSSHFSVEKGGMLAMVRVRKLVTDEVGAVRGEVLEEAIKQAKAEGLVPMFLAATFGTTSVCSFDNVIEMGPICEREGLWLHIDAAYAGSALICPEFRPLMKGIEHADSFNFNPHKWLQVSFDCSAAYFKDAREVVSAFSDALVDEVYIRHDFSGMPDFRHWQIPLGRRFRALKVWFVFRLFGISGLQAPIRRDVAFTNKFHQLVIADADFEVTHPVMLSLVCFRLKGDNSLTEKVLSELALDRRIFLVPGTHKEKFFLRFTIVATRTTEDDIDFAWRVIRECADRVLTAN